MGWGDRGNRGDRSGQRHLGEIWFGGRKLAHATPLSDPRRMSESGDVPRSWIAVRSAWRTRSGYIAFVGLLAAFAVLAGVLVARSSFPTIEGRTGFCLFDDAMISLRYAANLATGNGLVWNAGERVEGFTNPFMVFLMAVIHRAAGPWYAPLFVQILGGLTFLWGLCLVASIARHEVGHDTDTPVLAAVAGVGAFYPLLYWSVMGMETGLLTALLLAAFRADQDGVGARPSGALVVASGLAVLTRMDAVLFVGVLFAFRLPRAGRSGARVVLVEAGWAALPVVAYVLWRRGYYGQWLPSVYYLKLAGLPLLARLRNGVAFCAPMLPLVAVDATVVVAALRLRRAPGPGSQLPVVWRAIALFVVALLYQLSAGGDAWPPYWRFTVPAQVVLIVAAAITVRKLVVAGIWSRRAGDAALIGLVAFAAADSLRLYQDLRTFVPWTTDFNYRHTNTGLALRRLTTPSATVAAYWAGALPYFAERAAIDPLGKMDARIARGQAVRTAAWGGMQSVPGHNKVDLSYSFVSKRPTFIQYSDLSCVFGGVDLRAWCAENYVRANVAGRLPMLLLKDSPDVRWDLLRPGPTLFQ